MWNLWVFYDEIYKFLGFWIYGLRIEIDEFVVVVDLVRDDDSMMKKVEEERDWWWMNLWCTMKSHFFFNFLFFLNFKIRHGHLSLIISFKINI
jgi:hypothetical protein